MKKILLVAVLNMAIASCSPPKYTYYFDRYSAKIPKSYKAKDAVAKSASITFETNTANSSIPIHDQSLLASASNGVHVTPNKKTIVVEKDFKTSLLEIRKTDRRKLVQSVREFKRKIEPLNLEIKVKIGLPPPVLYFLLRLSFFSLCLSLR